MDDVETESYVVYSGTGADGSPLLFPGIEPNFRANLGIIDAVDFLTPFLHNHNVTAADLVQFAGALGMTQCQGAPALEFMAGRPNAQQVPPDGLVPDPNDSVDKILARFDDAGGFTADDVVALLASHSVARADHVDPTVAAAPFDTTPFTVSSPLLIFYRFYSNPSCLHLPSSTLNSSSRPNFVVLVSPGRKAGTEERPSLPFPSPLETGSAKSVSSPIMTSPATLVHPAYGNPLSRINKR
jgi:hypothetical protein